MGRRPLSTAALASQFPPIVRLRGADYARRGVVRLLSEDDDQRIRAEVFGADRYLVEIEVGAEVATSRCTCPYRASSGPCKHIWAALTLAERAAADDEDDEGTAAEERPEPPPPPPVPRFDGWESLIDQATKERISRAADAPALRRPGEIVYVLEPEAALATGRLRLVIAERSRGRRGGRPRAHQLTLATLEALPDPADRQLLLILRSLGSTSALTAASPALPRHVDLPETMVAPVLTLAAATGRLLVRRAGVAEPAPLAFDDGAPFELLLRVRTGGETEGGGEAGAGRASSAAPAPGGEREATGGAASDVGAELEVTGALARGDELVELEVPLVLTRSGWAVLPERVVAWRDFDLFALVATLRAERRLRVPARDGLRLLERLLALPAPPRLDLPEALRLAERTAAPRPILRLRTPPRTALPLEGALLFSYGEEVIAAIDPRGAHLDLAARTVLRRDAAAEGAARRRLEELGFRAAAAVKSATADGSTSAGLFTIERRALPPAARALIAEGFRVEADGRLFRGSGRFQLAVRSGVDWFDLEGGLDFGGVTAALPALLAAARGDGIVELGDGSFGLLPEDWLERYGLLDRFGRLEGDALRFRGAQAALLDVLLAAEPEVEIDELFARTRAELARFHGVEPAPPPPGFRGELRPYQQLGLGWLRFLERFGFGGCLADDMGLGKTVQVLAHLAGRRGGPRPSLVVVPKSLVWNWLAEAERFTPELRIVAHVGKDRTAGAEALASAEVVLTTYGLLKNDAALLRQVEFDYVILDEAQAIKNAGSATAKAGRLLRARHRLALSGTPVENHLGELWSIFEFLNPGLLGAAGALKTAAGAQRLPADQTTVLARALRPFILRRTKEQVTPELPPKHEETIVCELEGEQRRLYDELRDHYRGSLLSRIDREGLDRARMHVLEALLRLRQAACHPALVDPSHRDVESAKLDLLVPRLAELRDEGHKALVFSQFTSLLDLVEPRLAAEGIVFERLDGSTRDRQARVDRFQTDPSCSVFLLSLKAGGVGLNLTAAGYVFILDPWWNPAVEAQAIDRAHRIGQTERVFAYRLLCRDTVEEKIAALQGGKRALADAIVGEGNALVQALDRETIELLLA